MRTNGDPVPADKAGPLPPAGLPDDTATAVATEEAPAAVPAKPKVKAVTWETERNAAAAALAHFGATPREVRVLASLGALAASNLRRRARRGDGDLATVDERAARDVLAAHRAAARPEWKQ